MPNNPEDNCSYRPNKPVLPLIVGPIFFLVGLYFFFWHFCPEGYRYLSYRSAVEVPVTKVLHSDLIMKRGSKGRSSYTNEAIFQYNFDGRTYQSDMPSIYYSGDNFGSFQHELYNQIQSFNPNKQNLTCFVRPSHPTEAVINRDFRISRFAVTVLFFCAFSGIGGYITYHAIKS